MAVSFREPEETVSQGELEEQNEKKSRGTPVLIYMEEMM